MRKQIPILATLIILLFVFIVPAIQSNIVCYNHMYHSEEEFIIKFKVDFTFQSLDDITIKTLNDLNNKYDVISIKKVFRRISDPRLSKYYKISVPSYIDIFQAIKDYEKDENIDYAEPNHVYHICEIPNDEHWNKQWSLCNTGQTKGTIDADIDATDAWDVTKGSSNIIIAIADTGVDYDHIDLVDNIWVNNDEIPNNKRDDDNNGFIDDTIGWDFGNNDKDPNDNGEHGTHCAGIAAAVTNNNRGIAGVSWNSKIMPVKISKDFLGGITDTTAVEGIAYAVDNGAAIISMSWGNIFEFDTKIMRDTINYAYSKGVVLIAAAGNDHSKTRYHPAANDNVIAVASTDDNDKIIYGSTYGSWVDVAAPGENIYSTLPDDKYGYRTGSSMACPHVAGVAALILSKYPHYSNTKIREIIRGNVDSYTSDFNSYISMGRVNAYKTLSDNNRPNKPTTPTGPTSVLSDEKCNYTCSSTDPDDDNIQYGWDVDGNFIVDKWSDFYNSGEKTLNQHFWSKKDTFEMRVIARDIHGTQSEWSDPLEVSVPRAKNLEKPMVLFLLKLLKKMFF